MVWICLQMVWMVWVLWEIRVSQLTVLLLQSQQQNPANLERNLKRVLKRLKHHLRNPRNQQRKENRIQLPMWMMGKKEIVVVESLQRKIDSLVFSNLLIQNQQDWMMISKIVKITCHK
eukprot:NODE_1218_length_1745_cov_0.809842.p3 type:complete len:118 gc:universal NODE_1218_length_1745_cov_0.809842:874-521(-)